MDVRRNEGPGAGLDRREALRGRLEREGAVSLALRRLQRQTVHDLRGPLGSMSLHLALLGRAARGEVAGIDDAAAKQAEWVRAIERDLERLAAGLDRWSGLLDAGGGEPGRIDLSGVVRELGRTLAPLAERRQVELAVRLPEGGVFVAAVKDELTRLLAALACASMEALGSGAHLRLELRSDGARAALELAGRDPEAAPEAPVETPLAASAIAVLAEMLEATGGRLEAHGGAGWVACWPLFRGRGEAAADD